MVWNQFAVGVHRRDFTSLENLRRNRFFFLIVNSPLEVREGYRFAIANKKCASLHSGEGMKLRDHPLMTYKGIRSWPPGWLWKGGYETTHPEGEVSILRNVMPSNPTTGVFNHGALRS